MNKDSSMRVKVVKVPLRMLLHWLYSQSGFPEVVQLPALDLPDGFKVVGHKVGHFSNCLDVLVEHSSFEPVGECEEPPEWPDEPIRWEVRVLATDEEVRSRPIYVVGDAR